MKKIKVSRITMLFLLVLFVLSGLVIGIRHIYFANRQKEIKTDVINKIESKTHSEEEMFTDDIVGIIIIPSLHVEAPIYEGTTKEVLKYTVRTF